MPAIIRLLHRVAPEFQALQCVLSSAHKYTKHCLCWQDVHPTQKQDFTSLPLSLSSSAAISDATTFVPPPLSPSMPRNFILHFFDTILFSNSIKLHFHPFFFQSGAWKLMSNTAHNPKNAVVQQGGPTE